jgi:hypothetical protein
MRLKFHKVSRNRCGRRADIYIAPAMRERWRAFACSELKTSSARTDNIRDFETELSENNDAVRTRLRENETTIFENRPEWRQLNEDLGRFIAPEGLCSLDISRN